MEVQAQSLHSRGRASCFWLWARSEAKGRRAEQRLTRSRRGGWPFTHPWRFYAFLSGCCAGSLAGVCGARSGLRPTGIITTRAVSRFRSRSVAEVLDDTERLRSAGSIDDPYLSKRDHLVRDEQDPVKGLDFSSVLVDAGFTHFTFDFATPALQVSSPGGRSSSTPPPPPLSCWA